MSNNVKEYVLGCVYGRWVVIYADLPYSQRQGRLVVVKCLCDKETIKLVNLQVLRSGKSQSCGCLKIEKLVERSTIHGMGGRKSRNKIYSLWKHINSRCSNVNNGSYDSYGGRGIYVCSEWVFEFPVFNDWCLNNGWEEGLQLDRIDNDGPYAPWNCRFITIRENGFNKRLLQSNNTSGYCGVSYKPERKSFSAIVRNDGKTVFNKTTFKTAKDAALARDKFIIREGLPHKLNFPELAISWCL